MPRSPHRNRTLTAVQKQVWRFVARYLGEHRHGPSLADIRDHLGHKSCSTAYASLESLERAGCIKRIPGVARGLRLLKRPERAAASKMPKNPDGSAVAAK